MYLFHTPSLPKLALPSRERLQQLGETAITVLIWTAAITVTALRITGTGWAWLRPRLARMLHALALLLDPQLAAYPDQPEPDPTPEPPTELLCDIGTAMYARGPQVFYENQSVADAARGADAVLRRAAEKTGLPLHLISPCVAPAEIDAFPGPAPAATTPRAARRRTGSRGVKGAA